VATDIEWGDPKSKIIDAAAAWPADLIVLGSHGRTGLDRFLMGSVSDAVMRHAHCSVELVRIPPLHEVAKRAGGPQNGRFTRILLAVDDTEFSQAATRLLDEQVLLPQTEIRVLYVIEPPTLLATRKMGGYDPELDRVWQSQTEQAEVLVAKVAETFRGKRLKVTTCVTQGDPRSKILDEAREWKADLIVIGSHGRTSFARFLMGSVSDAVARHSHCSVEVVRTRPCEC
jgi:nucleotide-binding universal stress UspA family protein